MTASTRGIQAALKLHQDGKLAQARNAPSKQRRGTRHQSSGADGELLAAYSLSIVLVQQAPSNGEPFLAEAVRRIS